MENPRPGFVAVLDALGAKNFTLHEADQFLNARDEVLTVLGNLAKEQIKVEPDDLKTFIFNDTIVLAFLSELTYQGAWAFCHVLRGFEALFLGKQIYFRGAFGAGTFYGIDDKRNTIMGPAVTDAASWYERADWIGIHATPYATVLINSFLAAGGDSLDYVLVDYDVPLKDSRTMNLKAINWPKLIYLNNSKTSERAKAATLRLLAKGPIPKDSEAKYFNTIKFFDRCDELGLLEKRLGRERPVNAGRDRVVSTTPRIDRPLSH